MKVGLAGAGRIGALHAETLAAHGRVSELVVYDADEGRAREVAAKVGATSAPTADAFFAAGLNAVVIATSSSTHVELVEAGCDLGVPVFCEKPVALDVPQTKSVLDYAMERGVAVQVGFQRRFDHGYAAARREVQSGELGDLRHVHFMTGDPAPPPAAYVPTSGGIFRDMHIHDFDSLRWVTGREVAEVYATGVNRGEQYFVDAGDVDECAILMTMSDGTLVTMQGSRHNGNGYDLRMELSGTKATAVVGLSERSPLHSVEPSVEFPKGPAWVFFQDKFRQAYVDEIKGFIEFAAGQGENPCTIQDALEAFYIAEAADLSRREARAVRMSEVKAD